MNAMPRLAPPLVVAALLACGLPSANTAAPLGEVAYSTLPHATSNLVSGPDGNLWFIDTTNDRLGRITPGGSVTYISMPSAGPGLTGLTVGADGNLWTIEDALHQLARVTPEGQVDEGMLVPTNNGTFLGLVSGPDGNLWAGSTALGQDNSFIRISPFTRNGQYVVLPAGGPITHMTSGPGDSIYYSENTGTRVHRLQVDGTDSVVPGSVQAGGIAAGPDGRVWFTELSPPGTALVHAFNPATSVGTITATESGTGAQAITAGADGAMWYSQYSATPRSIARQPMSGGATAYSSGLPAVGAINSMTPAADGSTWFAGGTIGDPSQSVIGRIGTGIDRVAVATVSGSGTAGQAHSCAVAIEATGTGSESARRYAWLVDGQPVAGATAASYTPSAADAGRRLWCRATLTFSPSQVQMGFSSSQMVLVAPPAADGGASGGGAPAPVVAPKRISAKWTVKARRVTATFRPVSRANRYTIRATRAKARARTGTCRVASVRRTKNARPVRSVTCRMVLPKGRWTVRLQARRSSAVLAQSARAFVIRR